MSHLLSSNSSNASALLSDPPSNSSTQHSILIDPGPIYNSYTLAYFFIGFLITISASVLNAFGINLQKLDLNRSLANQNRKPDCFRPLWLLGLVLYVSSQVLGSTLALQYMRSEYVAPLGSASLIFNFLFARWLLGTEITGLDAIGTLVVIVGVVGVIGFGNIRQAGIDEEANMSLATLQALWARPAWLMHLAALELGTMAVLWLASIGAELIAEKTTVEPSRAEEDEVDVEMVLRRGGGRVAGAHSTISRILTPALALKARLRAWLKASIERWAISRPDDTLAKLDGLLWGCAAGLLAGQTLIFAKSFVKLVSNGFGHQGRGQPSDLANPLSILILVLLLATGILQVWCLNQGLKVYDSTLIVPVLFATYTASGFVNSLIYLHELPHYRTWVLLMIWLCIAVLVVGVWMLSAKRPETASRPKELGEYSSSADPEGEVQQTAIGREELVGMVMIGDELPHKQRPRSSSRDRNVSKNFRRRSSASEAREHGASRLRSGASLATRAPVDDLPSASGSAALLVQRSGSVKNPFEDFELIKGEELEEDQSEDEIDGLGDGDVRNGYTDDDDDRRLRGSSNSQLHQQRSWN